MTTARKLITDVSRYLTDQEEYYEFSHWTEGDLFSYLRLAIAIVASTDKNSYTRKIEVPLIAGSAQDIPDTCQDAKVRGVIDAQGNMTLARKLNIDPSAGINRPICSATTTSSTGYVMQSWSMSDDDPNTVWVYPPVPESAAATMVVSCYSPPDIQSMDEEIDIDIDKEPAVFELMLYYAFGVDIESTAMRERSESHFNKAFTILGVSLTAAGTRKGTK